MATRKTATGMTKSVATRTLFDCPVCKTAVVGTMLLALTPDGYDPDSNSIKVAPAGLRVSHNCIPKGTRVRSRNGSSSTDG